MTSMALNPLLAACKNGRWCAGLLKSGYQKHQQQLIDAAVVHFDESGMRVEGKLHWLHIAANSEQVIYSCQTRRGQGGMDAAGILPPFKGIAVHDCWQQLASAV